MSITEIYKPSEAAWAEIRSAVIALEKDAFGDKAFSDDEIAKDFLSARNTTVLLKDEGEVVGFTYARPLDEAGEPDRESEAHETAYVWDTIIDKRYRGKGLIGSLMGELEKELKRKGYSFIERTAVVANDYAAHIAKRYGDRIITSEPVETKYGKQVFFRIKL